MRRSNASAITASAVNAPGMYRAAPNVSGSHSAPAVEASATSAEASAATAPGQGVVRNQACAYDNQRCQCSQ